MSDRRHDAATATVGLAGVGASGALRHSGLEAAYEGGARPRFLQERKFLTRAKVPGRRRYATAAALGLVSVPPAAVGTSRLIRRESASKADKKERSFIGEGLAGARESFTERNQTVKERPPARLVAGNYVAGGALGSAAGGLTHMALGRTKIPGSARAAAASAAGVLAGSATLPLQSRLTQRASHGQYVVTPTGVRRKRTKAKPASAGAHIVEGRPGKATLSGHALRQEMVGKAYDPGGSMSRGERRARVTASGVPIPIVGDVAQAATAARLSPEPYRRRTAVQNFAGGQAGSLTGNVIGAAGALALARKSPGFERRALKTGQQIERVKAAARTRAGIKPAEESSRLESVLTHPKTPRPVTRAGAAVLSSRPGRAVAANPGVAAVGALGGGMAGGQVGQQTTYNHIMTRDDRYRRQHSQSGRSGSRLAKRDDKNTGMSRADELRQIKRKRRSAAVSAITSTGAIGALGALAAAPMTHGKVRGRLVSAGTVGGTVSGGLSAINGLEGAHLQRRDLKAREQALLSKGILRPRMPGMRRGYLRQVRTATGVKTSSVRGGFSKLDTTMSDHRAHQLARQYDTRGTLPKTLDRNQRMAAYEARYIASGGKKGEKWKRRADRAEVGRNVGLAGATLAGAAALGHKAPGLRRISRRHLESAGLASGVLGGAAELYGEHARSRRASYQNSPAGVAASALQRMRAYTPGGN